MKRIACLILALILMTVSYTALAATRGEENAVRKAQSYLDFMSFSYQGLYVQLQYEGFSDAECKYGVDNCGADWFDQAARKAESYLDFMSFSKSGLITQLEYEGFTTEQAQYGAAVAYGENPTKPGESKQPLSVTIPETTLSAKTTDEKENSSEEETKEITTETETVNTVAVSTNFDVSALSYDELITLENRIIQELTSRPEYKTVLVPTGAYKVGIDIPAGKWTITATEGACEVYWGKALDEYGVEIPRDQRIDYLDDWGSKSSATWELIDGTYILVCRNAVTFTPFVPTSLGF